MANTIDMQQMRYINLFEKITGIQTRYCFPYNDFIVFAVPRQFVSRAIGKEGKNVRKLNDILKRKIKVIASPEGNGDARQFIADIVNPVMFKDLQLNGNEIVITAGATNKAALLGRNKRRLEELKKVVKGFFSRELRIV